MSDQLLFKRGTQASLNTITESIDGAFYLTTDTHRLYIGDGAKPKLLNQTVQIVDSYKNLPTTAAINDFYYTTQENILCVYNGSVWKQINPDRDTKVEITSADFGLKQFQEGETPKEDELVYTLTLSTQNYDKNGDVISNSQKNITADLTLSKELIANIVPEMSEVGLEINKTNNEIKLQTVGAGSDTTKAIKISGEGNVAVSASEDSITINGIMPEIKIKDSALAVLDAVGNIKSSIEFEAGEGLDVKDENGAFVYSHLAYETTTNENQKTEDDYVASIDEISNGHITKYTTKKFTKYVNKMSLGKEESTKYTITLQDANGDVLASQDLADLVEDAKGYADTLVAEEIAKVSSALQYKGIVDADKTVDDPQVGWVYMSSVNGTVLGVNNVKIGDLLVYYEDENTNQSWQLIPSGDELFTTYQMGLSSATNGITYSLLDGNGNPVNHSQVLEIIGDENEAISIILTSDKKVSIKHKEIAVDVEDETDVTKTSITAIVGIETDDNGHITKYNTKTFEAKTYNLKFSNNSFALKDETGEILGAPVIGDGLINIIKDEDDNIVLQHTKLYNEDNNSEETVVAGITQDTSNSIEKVREITFKEPIIDEYGHITSFNDVTFQIQDDNTVYALKNTDGIISLKDQNGNISGSSISFDTCEHTNLTLELEPTTNEGQITNVNYKFNLTWGEF